jgi:CheY-like chemotaxis protein
MGGTRVELVTPSVSSWCSNQTELAAPGSAKTVLRHAFLCQVARREIDADRRASYDRRVTFLVVDGSPDLRDMLCRALVPHGVRGIPASDRASALARLAADPSIDGAIVDLDDAAVGGDRLIAELRGSTRERGLSVFALASRADRSTVRALIERGVAGCLLKPLAEKDLEQRIGRLLAPLASHHSQRRHIRVHPEPGELVRAHFRMAGGKGTLAGRVVDVSLGGMAIELLSPEAPSQVAAGMRVEDLGIVVPPREIAASGVVVSVLGRTMALRFDPLAAAAKAALERYIYGRISA